MSESVSGATTYAPPAWLQGLQRRAFFVGGLLSLVAAAGAVGAPEQFLRAYLVGFLFWIGVPLGCFGVRMLQQMTGGAWGLVARRICEAATRTLPLLALLFVPVLAGMRILYVWARPEAVAGDEILQHKQPYLNVPFFVARTALYFLVWWGAAAGLDRWSRQQDRTGEPRLHRRMQLLASVGLVSYMLTASFAAFDWLMSLDPLWYSSLFGMSFVVGQGVTAFCFLILCVRRLAQSQPLSGVLAGRHFDDLGKLLLAFVLLWVYMSYSQYLIIWSGNLPEEITWYVRRRQSGFAWLGVVVFVLHFVVPFLLLMSRALRRDPRRLAWVALPVLVARWLDLHWQAIPSLRPGGPMLTWLDVVVPVAMGGIWVGAFVWQLRRRALLPLRDPHLQEALGDA